MLSSPTTNLVERISYSDGDEIEYTYDAEERITSVKGKYTNFYEYDCHGQLTKETYTDSDGIDIVEVSYDSAGNITEKDGKVYEYDSTWKDLLVKYDGKNIYYDALGNPTTYLGNILTWTAGRKLQSFGDNISYKYNSFGQRITKTVGDTVHEYFYEGARLVKEIRTASNGTTHTLVFLYDASESPIGMQYDGTAYYYKKNLQGDVIALLDASCTTVAEYVYDAWGALRTIEADTEYAAVAEANPIRYRGYYYDTDTNLYFLQSRYYDPVVGRFLNADRFFFGNIDKNTLSLNSFIYCNNDPTNQRDISGNIPLKIILRAILGAFLGAAKQYIGDVLQNLLDCVIDNTSISKDIWKARSSWADYLFSIVTGACDATLKVSFQRGIIATALATLGSYISNWCCTGKFNVAQFVKDLLWNILLAMVTEKLCKKFTPKQGKKLNQYIRSHFKVKGTSAYSQYYTLLEECVAWNGYIVSTFVDVLRAASRRILDFIERILMDCFIQALANEY